MHVVDFCGANTYILLSFVMLPGIFILDSMDNSSQMESFVHETSCSLLTSLEEKHSHNSSPLSDANTDNNDSQHFKLPNLENNPELFEPLYSGSNISFCGAVCSIMQFCMMHKLTYTAIGELLKLLQVLCPIPNRLPTTVFKLKKFFNQFNMSYDYSNVCSHCDTQKDNCHCDHPVHNSHLIHIPLEKPLYTVLSSKYNICSITAFILVALCGAYGHLICWPL